MKNKNKKATNEIIPITKFIHLLLNYNKKHKTHYSYGQMQEMIANKTISKKDFET